MVEFKGEELMPWTKKTKTASDWKPVRVRKEWLDLMRVAGKENPRFSPTIDLTTASEPKTLEFACRVSGTSSDRNWTRLLRWSNP